MCFIRSRGSQFRNQTFTVSLLEKQNSKNKGIPTKFQEMWKSYSSSKSQSAYKSAYLSSEEYRYLNICVGLILKDS